MAEDPFPKPRRGPDGLIIHPRLTIPWRELSFSFSRSGGPGGQRANKVETKVTLRFGVATSLALGERRRADLLHRLGSRLTTAGELVLSSDRHREQTRNREEVQKRLVAILSDALQPTRPRKATFPTRGSQERRMSDKRHRGEIKRGRGHDGRQDDGHGNGGGQGDHRGPDRRGPKE